jgi:hypothetical protein
LVGDFGESKDRNQEEDDKIDQAIAETIESQIDRRNFTIAADSKKEEKWMKICKKMILLIKKKRLKIYTKNTVR